MARKRSKRDIKAAAIGFVREQLLNTWGGVLASVDDVRAVIVDLGANDAAWKRWQKEQRQRFPLSFPKPKT